MEIISDSSQSQAQPAKTNPALQAASGLNLKSIIALLLSKWYWFVISLAVTVSGAFVQIKRTVPTYTRTASILIKDDSKGSASTSVDMSEFGISASNVNLDNEIRTLKSPSLMKIVVERLGLNNIYSEDIGLRSNQLYHESPVLFSSVDTLNNFSVTFKFITPDGKKVDISEIKLNGEPVAGTISTMAGDTIAIGGHRFAVVHPEWNAASYYGKELDYAYTSVKGMAKGLAAQLVAMVGSDKSSIIDLSITRPSIAEADDILLMLIQVYNERWLQDKNQVSVSTSRFIDERLAVIEQELGNVESDISSYKSEHLMPDVAAASAQYMSESATAQAVITDLNNQISVAELIRRQLQTESLSGTLVVNSGVSNSDVLSLVNEYNATVLERNRLLESTGENSPVVKDRTMALQAMRETIQASLSAYISALQVQLNNARRQVAAATGKIASNPSQAKYLLSIERQQKVKESLYLFLLQKREENELSQAFTAYNTSLIDEPDGSLTPSSPSSTMIILIAVALGLAIPLGVLLLREILDTKIRGKRDLSALTIPYLGEIPSAIKRARGFDRLKQRGKKRDHSPDIVVEAASRNSINEAFRVLRTNVEYIGGDEVHDGQCKVIAITSANPSSGKTFISINLAKVLAIKGKRVCVIDLDLRKGSLSKIVGHVDLGITDYLIGKAAEDQIIIKGVSNTPTLDAITVGTVPPNPAELLSSERLDTIIESLKQRYDFIVLDCPPVEIVTDAKVINRLAYMTMFVVRAGLLEKDELPNIQEYYDQNRYNRMTILLNGTDIHSGYGYHRYGYHYGYHYGYGRTQSYYTQD